MAGDLTLHLDPDRFRRTICATRPYADDDYLDAFATAGVKVLRLNRHGRRDLRAWTPLFRELRSTDVLHTHKFGSNAWGVTIGRLARVPVIVAHEHTWSFEGQPMRRLLDRELIARGANVFVMVSHEDRRRAQEIEGIDLDRTRYMPNGIAPVQVTGHDIRTELDIPAGAPVIGTVASLRQQKALDVLIRAALALRQSFPGLHVLIVGRGPEHERLAGLISELGLGDTVRLLGRRSDIGDILAALDVAVCTSAFEGLPLSIMEYMSAGLAVVATRVGGVPELIEDGVHGILVERGDVAAVEAAVADLLRNPDRRSELGSRARIRQQAEFEIGNVTRRFEALYEELFAAQQTGRRRRTVAAARDA